MTNNFLTSEVRKANSNYVALAAARKHTICGFPRKQLVVSSFYIQ